MFTGSTRGHVEFHQDFRGHETRLVTRIGAAFVPEERRTRGTDLFYLQNVALSPPRMHVYSFSYVTDLKIRVAVRADVISFALLISRARTFFTAGIRDSK